MSILRSEPALVGGVAAGAGILLSAVFLSPGQLEAVGTLIPIVAAVFIRQQVVPASKVMPIIPPPGAQPPP